MGEVVHVSCGVCKKIWRCMTGSGLAYAYREKIVAAFQEKEWEKVTALMAMSEIPAYDFKYRLAACSNCHNVVGVPTLALSETDKPYVGLCPLCGERTKEPAAEDNLEEWSQKTACPACSSRRLEMTEIGNWD